MFLTLGFSGRDLTFFVYTSTRLQFSRWNIIYNVHDYHYNS